MHIVLKNICLKEYVIDFVSAAVFNIPSYGIMNGIMYFKRNT